MLKKMLILVCLLSACGLHAEEIEFIAWDYKMPGERAFYDTLIREFEAANPGITVKFTLGEWSGGPNQKLPAHDLVQKWCAAGSGPDIVVMPDIWLVEFLDHIEPYGKHAPEGKSREYFPVLYKKGVINGRWTGPVWATSTKALIYRKDLMDEAGLQPPKTWQELLDCAVKLNDPPRVYGFGLAGKLDYDTSDNFYYFFWSAGGKLIGPDGRAGINGQAGVKSLQFLRDLIFKHNVVQPGLTQHHRHDTEELFIQGKIAMTENGPWLVASCRKRAPDLKIGVVPLPVDKLPVTQTITDHMILMGYSRRKDAAAKLMNFATQDQYRLAFTKLGMVPEKPAVAADPHFRNDPAWKVFVDIIPTGRSIPKLPWERVELAMQKALNGVYAGEKDVKVALNEVAVVLDKLIHDSK